MLVSDFFAVTFLLTHRRPLLKQGRTSHSYKPANEQVVSSLSFDGQL
jgi:hypothetical protein